MVFLRLSIILIFAASPFLSFAATYSGSEVPLILPRSSWNTEAVDLSNISRSDIKDVALPSSYAEKFKSENSPTPGYSKIERIIIHDTGCCDSAYEDSKELIRSIYRNHALQRGWGDIGYHYIIDKKGVIYEAREGGNGSRGAHVYDYKACTNFNVGTIGVAVLGDYEHKDATEASKIALSQLVGWLSAVNNLEPKDTNKTTDVWTNPKFQGECITKYGGSFSRSFSGPVILGHKDIEPANTDPGLLDLDYLRIEAQKWKEIYKGYIYNSDGSVFTIKNGVRDLVSGVQSSVRINASQANLFKLEVSDKLPNGALLKSELSPAVFLIENQERKHISSYEIFQKRGYLFKDVKTVSEEEILEYSLGSPITDSSSSELLVRESTKEEVYLVKDNKARWIKTYEAFKQLGYSMARVVLISKDQFSKYALGSVIAAASDLQKTEEVVVKEPAKTLSLEKTETETQGRGIRIALAELEASDEVRLSADGDFHLIDSKGNTTLYKAGETAKIIWASSKDIKIKALNKDTIFEVLSYTDYNWNDTVNFNKFRGSLELIYSEESKKLWLVNELPFEEYLLGMAEAMDKDPKEYQKAFAVSARSYAFFHLENGGKRGRDEVYHLNNTSSDQVYRGYDWELYAPSLPQAMKETRGEVLKYNGKVARAVYSSDSGGVTKNACSFWRGVFCTDDYGYLAGGVKDPAGTERRSAQDIKDSHGVGMSATGGRKLAELGKSYEEILKYYYKDISLGKL